MTDEDRINSVKPLLLDAVRLAFVDDVKTALEGLTDNVYEDLSACDSQGNTALHLLAANSKDQCIDLLLKKAGDDALNLIALQNNEGNTALHLCAHFPMACYQLAAEAPAVCLVKNKAGLTPIDLARQHGSGEALNALLLACSGNSTCPIESLKELTTKGAVADTWAPNGQSSLMLAAAANSAQAITLLLSAGASLELQDAMGRTALMWAAGSDSVDALKVLLDAGASVALRDRRHRSACDYAEKPEAKKVLEARVKELESKATAAQEALLAELLEEEERKAASKASKKAKKRAKAKEKKEKTSSTRAVKGDEEETITSGGGGSISKDSDVTEVVIEEEEDQEEETSPDAAEIKEAEPCSSTATPAPPLPSTSHATEAAHPTSSTKTPPMPSAPLAIAATELRPPSPEWCTVGAPKKEKPPASNTPPKAFSHSHHPHHPYQHRRSPSVGSVTSVSSGTSHETDGSGRHSGSERSVLRRVAAAGAVGTSVPRLPAPVQRQAACTRSTSGGEEVGAAAMFGVAATTIADGATFTDGAGSGGGIKPGSWASVAASQRSGSMNANNSTAAAVTAQPPQAFVAPEKKEHQQQQQELTTTSQAHAHATLASGIPQGAWTRSTTTSAPDTLTTTTATTPSGGSSIDGGSHSNYIGSSSCIPTNITVIAASETTGSVSTTTTAASALAFQRAAAEEIATLRSEIQRLKLKNAAAELAHHQELVAVLQDASQHENAAVAKATSDERMACTIRFAAMLQNNGVALAGAMPGLLAGAGVATATDLDLFLSNSSVLGGSSNTSGRSSGVSADRAIITGNMNINSSNDSNSMSATAAAGGGGVGGVGASETSPLSTSPFSYEVGEHLRGDFFGNHSAFMVPAIETHPISASPPQSSSFTDAAAESYMANAAAAAAAAWSPLGNGSSSSVWGNSSSAIR